MKRSSHRRLLLPWMLALITSMMFAVVQRPAHATYKIDDATASATVDVQQAVCYFTDSNGKHYFGKIEEALDAAKDLKTAITVFVMPNLGHSVSIKKDCIIANKVSLVFPYSDEKTDSPVSTSDNHALGFADSDDDYGNTNQAATNRKTQVVLETGVQLIIESGGTLNITGVRGNKDSPNAQGQTSGAYTELVMKPNSRIECNGTITCFGYIREDYAGINGISNDNISGDRERSGNGSYINVGSSGAVTEPLIIYDFRGGSATSQIYTKIFPLNLFDLPQISPQMYFEAGGKLNGAWNIYAGSQNFSNTSVVIGTQGTGFIQSASGNDGVIAFKNTDTSQGTAITNLRSKNKGIQNNHVMDLKLKGHYIFGSIKIKFSIKLWIFSKTISIDSSEHAMPMSNLFQIVLQNQDNPDKKTKTKFEVSNKLTLLPGSSATIEEGASAVFSSDLAVLSYTSNGMEDPRPKDHYYKGSDLSEASLINNGSLELNSSFGGKITTTSQKTAQATIKTDTNFKNSVTVNEITSGSSTTEYKYEAKADFSGSQNQTLMAESGSYISNPGTAYWQEGSTSNAKSFTSTFYFNAKNAYRDKVALGKGLLTKRKLEQLIARYGGKAT